MSRMDPGSSPGVRLTGLAGKAISLSAPVNGVQGEALESGAVSDECSLFPEDGGLAGKHGCSQTGVGVPKY